MQAAGALQKLGRAAVVARAGPNWGQVARMSSSGENLQEKYPKMFPRALRNILPMMCERGSWNYAEAWARDEKSDTRLKCITTFSDEYVKESKKFKKSAKNTKYNIGEGIVGKTWATGEPQWLNEVSTHSQGPAEQFRTSYSVPVVVDGNVQAVLNFYAEDSEWPQPEPLQDFASLPGPLLGTTLELGGVRPKLSTAVAIGAGELAGKGHRTQEQMDAVFDEIVESGVFTPASVYEDVQYFYNDLGLPDDYFDRHQYREIVQHVTAYMSAKKLAASADPRIGRDSKQEEISARVITSNGLCIMVPSDRESVMAIEKELDYMRSDMDQDSGMTVARYMSKKSAVPYGSKELMMYIVDIEKYTNSPEALAQEAEDAKKAGLEGNFGMMERDIAKVSTPGFYGIEHLRSKYQRYIDAKQNQLSIFIENDGIVRPDGTRHIVIGTRSTTDGRTSTRGMNQLISECIGPNLNARRKYLTTFSNGLIFHSIYLDSADDALIQDMIDQVKLLSVIPRDSCKGTLDLLTVERVLKPEAFAYSVCASNFAFYFLQSNNPDLEALKNDLMKSDPDNLERLKRIATVLQQQAVPMSRINECITKYPKIVAELYEDFEATFSPSKNADKGKKRGVSEDLRREINNPKNVVAEIDRVILNMFATFNESTAKTNFYNNRKSTLAFRVQPEMFFGGLSQFDETPYGIFMIMSNDFRGFHVRFQPVARGGLRLIQSKTEEAVYNNLLGLFNENYNLALTQNKKNKDIPEFGSKGTILLEKSNQSVDAGKYAFYKYISGMMDMLVPRPGEIVDWYGKEEIIFFGPDEGTAPYMEDAAKYAKERGYGYWKACTTGKPPSMGGIPHDVYGMTTLSVRQFVWGALEKAGFDRKTVRKVQTGGPDGDLGSNEILLSEDVTTVMSDVTGVVFDPDGLDRAELARLAGIRRTADHFDQSKLSPQGMFVPAKKQPYTLPDGTELESGLAFRDEFLFHPIAKADLFVPCGGRPGVIDATNVHKLLNPETGEHQFKIIVEGANLYITEAARDILEAHGVTVYKDASTNKGGVTSSSLEVLASLCMTDEEHATHMQADVIGKDAEGNVQYELKDFYKEYVKEVVQIVESNAHQEFAAVHKHAQATKTPRWKTTDILSDSINTLNTACRDSTLYDDERVRTEVLRQAIPKSLQELIGLDTIVSRLPEDYKKAVFGYYVASQFVYKTGMEMEEFEKITKFYEHMAAMVDGSTTV